MIGKGELLSVDVNSASELIQNTPNSIVCALRELCSNYLIRGTLIDPTKECNLEDGCPHPKLCKEIDACAQP